MAAALPVAPVAAQVVVPGEDPAVVGVAPVVVAGRPAAVLADQQRVRAHPGIAVAALEGVRVVLGADQVVVLGADQAVVPVVPEVSVAAGDSVVAAAAVVVKPPGPSVAAAASSVAGSRASSVVRSSTTSRLQPIGGVQVPRGHGEMVRLPRGASLTDFADRINANPASLVQVLFTLGEMATATQSLDEDTFQLLAAELGYEVQIVSPEDEDRELLESFDIDLDAEVADQSETDLQPRPPVVTVMGHVDHGKTKLLDAIRETDVVADEAGGITQHIGAYQVHVPHDGVERAITFIDTPGHEAFTAMRARGAKVTDIAVLVVAADDGVMPQTVEALNHALAAEVPIVVAVNKVDKEDANPAKVRQQLTEYGLIAEEYGGETMFVDVSAKGRLHIDKLLEAILLTADASLDLRANPKSEARGIAIEAHLDRGRGPVATVLVQRGTLQVGESIVAGDAFGRVRAMVDEHGHTVEEAGPSRPVMVLGLTSVPGAGDKFLVSSDDRTARQIAEKRQAAERNAQLAKTRKKVSLEDLQKILEQGAIETLNLILKGDVSGSVEALEDALIKVEVGEDVDLRNHPPRRGLDHRARRHARLGVRSHHHRLQRAPRGSSPGNV